MKDMSENQYKSSKYLYVPTSGRVVVRFVGSQVEMFQYFNKSYFSGNNGGSGGFGTMIASLSSPPSGERVFFREDDNGDNAYTRSKRVVSLVIDRADERIKAFAAPISVWNQMTEFAKENDFEIWREGQGLKPCGSAA